MRNSLGQFIKGLKPHNKGKSGVSDKTRELMRLSKIKAGIKPPSRKGLKDSNETRMLKKQSAKRGNKNNRWKGGVTSLNHKIRNCFEYRQWRSDVFKRDDYRCVLCNIRSGNGVGVYLEADHFPKMFFRIREEYKIKTLEEALVCEELWDINNGRTLCRLCHNKNKKWKV